MSAAGLKGGQWARPMTTGRRRVAVSGVPRRGAILTEAASVSNLAYPYTRTTPIGDQQPAHELHRAVRPEDLDAAPDLDYTSNTFYTGVETMANDPYTWLYNFYQVGRRAVTKTSPYAYVIPAGQRDPRPCATPRHLPHRGGPRSARRGGVHGGRQELRPART